ncbi:hypothetical protein ACQF4J_47580 (plasmid) [Streptomyces sp. C1-1]|uniref:hypothetical protein n=1 Tax=Streptomyces sp. C1-1 TaxID=3231173 RepID=UPI003D02C2F7
MVEEDDVRHPGAVTPIAFNTRHSGALSREQLLHTGSALFIEKAACLFKPLRCDVVAGCQYYLFGVGQLFRSRVENRIRCMRTPFIVASAFRHHLSCV